MGAPPGVSGDPGACAWQGPAYGQKSGRLRKSNFRGYDHSITLYDIWLCHPFLGRLSPRPSMADCRLRGCSSEGRAHRRPRRIPARRERQGRQAFPSPSWMPWRPICGGGGQVDMSLRAGIGAISRPGRSKGSWTELLRRQGSRRPGRAE